MSAIKTKGPPIERVKELLIYDPITGVFRWRMAPGRRGGAWAGDVAGWKDTDTNYWKLSIDYKHHLAHRVVWLLMRGEWPSHQIDHINNVRDDNRWENLRQATQAQNNYNSGYDPRNTSGYRGVSRVRGGKWRAQVSPGGKVTYLGSYDTAELAAQVYDEHARIHYGEYAKLNFPRDIENWE